MTGPAVPSDEELREVAARAMFDSDYDGTDFHWEDLTDGPDAGRNYYRRHADALLPVVRRYADQRAAEELTDFADLIDRGPTFPLSPSIFSAMARERAADALSREATT